VRVIKPKRIGEYAKQYSDAAESLLAWLKAAESADWGNIQEVKETYPHADAARVASGSVVTIFNLRGNRYRLITSIKYRWGVVYVLRFLTHADYDKEKWKAEL
jgi:mRNA interferase HigB